MLVNGKDPLNHHGETVINGLETVGNGLAKADALPSQLLWSRKEETC
jgi:hypothetical protein